MSDAVLEAQAHRQRGSALIGLTLTVLLGVGTVAGFGTYLHRQTTDAQSSITATMVGQVSTPKGSMPHATLTLGVYPDAASSGAHGADGGPFPGYVSYGPATHLILPAHSLVTITINGYDSGERLANAFFGRVVGTADGTMTVNGQTVTSVPVDQVEHTFTLHGVPSPNQDTLFVNIPLTKQTDEAMKSFDDAGKLPKPIVTTFSFYTGSPGEYVFNCEYPCGDGTYAKFGAAMGKFGYMSGTVSVVDHV